MAWTRDDKERFDRYMDTPYIAGANPWDDLAMMYTGEVTEEFEIELPDEDEEEDEDEE